MASKWYYEKSGVRHGPVSSEDIRRMASEGTLLPSDLLWKEGVKEWIPAGQSSNLFPQGTAQTAPRNQLPPPPLCTATPPLPDTQPKNSAISDLLGTATARKEAMRAIGENLKTAGTLIQKQTYRTKLRQIDLPRAFAALGQRVYSMPVRPPELASNYARIDALKQQCAAQATEHAERPEQDGISGKAKQLITGVNDLARRKVAETQISAEFTRLGESVLSKARSLQGCEQYVTSVEDIQKAMEQLESEIESLSQASSMAGGITPYRFLAAGAGLVILAFAWFAFSGSRATTTEKTETAMARHAEDAPSDPGPEADTEPAGTPNTSRSESRTWGKNKDDKLSVFLECSTLTRAEAKEVVEFNPAWGISFQQLEELTPEAAVELSKYKGQWIAFRKPTRFTPQAAGILSGFQGELGMFGVSEVTPEFCRLFRKHRGVLRLGDVRGIDDAVAKALGERQGGVVLSGLATVSETQLEELLSVGGPLEVSGVGQLRGFKWLEALPGRAGRTVLDGNTDAGNWGQYGGQCICNHPASLFLKNVHVVPDEVARAVADKPGHISFADDATMSPAAKAILEKRNELEDLYTLDHLYDRLAEGVATRAQMADDMKVAAGLYGRPTEVFLPKVRVLADGALKELVRFRGKLTLGITSVSDADAATLANSSLFWLHLPKAERMSLHALTSLAKAKKMTLELPTLLSLTDDFVRALQDHKRGLIFDGLQSITDEQVEVLSRKEGDLKLPQDLNLTDRQKRLLSARKVDKGGGWWRDQR